MNNKIIMATLLLFTISIFSKEYKVLNGNITKLKKSDRYIALKLDINNSKDLKDKLLKLNLPSIDKIKYINNIFIIKFSEKIDKTIFKNEKLLSTYNVKDEWPLILSNKIIVKFKDNISKKEQKKILDRYNLKIIDSFNFSDGAFNLLIKGNQDSFKLSNILYNLKIFEYAYPNFYIYHKKHFIPNDPLYSHQWHLNGNNIATNGVNAQAAWDINKGSSSVKIAILDDGVDTTHEDLNVVESYDFVKNETDTNNIGDYYEDQTGEICHNAPYTNCTFVENSDAFHGTACAGVAAAKGDNNRGVTGLCINCSILAYQIMNSSGYGLADADIRAFERAKLNADVISCSWGYPAEYGSLSSLNPALKDTISSVALTGRGGKGTPILFATGNEGDNFISDSLPGISEVISVGAVNYKDELTLYSNYGDNIFVVAPSNPSSYFDYEDIYLIWTTDISGDNGYHNNTNHEYPCDYLTNGCQDYTSSFGGTSSATPLVSGLVGLMLSQNNSLTLENIKTILKTSSNKINISEESGDSISTDGFKCDTNMSRDYNSNGHSICMGYGKIDAQSALIKTRDFNTLPSCDGIDCSNHGDCLIDNNQTICSCDNGYHPEGLSCILDSHFPCEGVTCSNHGDCILLDDAEACLCDEGYHDIALECIENDIDRCEGVTCQDNASCNSNTGDCECNINYHLDGNNCIKNVINQCEGVTCQDNASCNSNTGSCICDSGYFLDKNNICKIKINKTNSDSCSYTTNNDGFFLILFFLVLFYIRKNRNEIV